MIPLSSASFSMTNPVSAPAVYLTVMEFPSALVYAYSPRTLPEGSAASDLILKRQGIFNY